MNNSGKGSQNEDFISPWKKILNIFVGALIFGWGWHIRGSGTSDPTVVMLMFLLFIGFIFSPRKKFNGLIFGLINIIHRIGRRGWGTFVSQAGIPGLFPGELQSPTEGYSVLVPWWQGFFWLFIVGVAWSGFTALILGGYQFSDKKYDYKELIIWIVLYVIGYVIGQLIALAIIPSLAPEAYNEIYLGFGSERNYNSMRDNFSFAFAIIPVLLYIFIRKRDTYFIKMSLIIMLIYGIGFSVADLWQVYGRNVDPALPFWSMWEYTTGFIIGASLMLVFYLIPEERWQKSDIEIDFYPADTKFKKFILYVFGHVLLFLYAIAESTNGLIRSTYKALNGEEFDWFEFFFGIKADINTVLIFLIILLIDLPLYYLYMNDKFLTNFKSKDFQSKCIFILILLIPYFYMCYTFQFIATGTFFTFETSRIVMWWDTVSVIIIESYLLFKIKKEKRFLNGEIKWS